MKGNSDLGIIPKDRLRRIPEPLRVLHEAAFFFHDLAVSALKEYDRPDLRSVAFKSKALAAIPPEELKAMDGIDLLRRIGRDADARNLMINECVLALISDGLQFVCEALFSYEKGKIAVSLNLLRKPMKENLLYLEWIIGNDKEFFQAFSSLDRLEMNIGRIRPEKRKAIIHDAITRLACLGPYSADALYSLRYDKSNAAMEPLWHKAAHLVTTQNANFTTEPENFNMIFASEDVRQDIYGTIGKWYLFLVMYFYSISITALERLHPLHAGTIFYNDMCSMVATTLVTGEDSALNSIIGELTEFTNQHLPCPRCGKNLSVTDEDVACSFFSRTLTCSACKSEIEFDLYELMQLEKRHSDLNIS